MLNIKNALTPAWMLVLLSSACQYMPNAAHDRKNKKEQENLLKSLIVVNETQSKLQYQGRYFAVTPGDKTFDALSPYCKTNGGQVLQVIRSRTKLLTSEVVSSERTCTNFSSPSKVVTTSKR